MTPEARGPASELLRSEDYWAIWLGGGLLVAALVIFLPLSPDRDALQRADRVLQSERARAPFRTIAWYEASEAKAAFEAKSHGLGKPLGELLRKPKRWSEDPSEALWLGERAAARQRAAAASKAADAAAELGVLRADAERLEQRAAAVGFGDAERNAEAAAAIARYRAQLAAVEKLEKRRETKPYNLLPSLALLGLSLALLLAVGIAAMGRSPLRFLLGFGFVFALAVLSYLAAGQVTVKELGVGYAAWAIVLGLSISNTVGTPRWAQPAVQTEFFIKTGLVLLGGEVLLSKILAIGLPGIFVAWVVTPVVLVTTYWFGQRVLRIGSRTLNIVISADMSVCGVSAAIATAAACRAKKEELTLAVGLSLVFTSIMMVVMPAVIKALGIGEVLGGAWIGGTIDATGAVAAAGAFLGERALHVAATIKMIQNVLIGVIAFGVAVYFGRFATAAEGDAPRALRSGGALREIWRRFPKFVLGFLGASIAFSVLSATLGPDLTYSVIDQGAIGGLTKPLRGWLFCLAFVSIGLATDFRVLRRYLEGGKPLLLYLAGQALNLLLTFGMAYLMFELVFRDLARGL